MGRRGVGWRGERDRKGEKKIEKGKKEMEEYGENGRDFKWTEQIMGRRNRCAVRGRERGGERGRRDMRCGARKERTMRKRGENLRRRRRAGAKR